jgi:type I restriction enzyme S subunit
MAEWPKSTVGPHVVQRVDKQAIELGAAYDTMGVRWYGRGAYLRPSSRPQTKSLNRAHAGDFVFCRIDVQNGPFAVVPAELDGALVTSEFPLYTVNTQTLDADYLALCFASEDTRGRIGRLRDGRDGRARWKEADFEAWEIPLPPVPVQKQIVKVMQAVDEVLHATASEASALAEILKIRRATLIDDDAHPTVRADEAFDIRLGRQRSPQRATGPSMTPYLRSANVGYDELRLDDVMEMDFDERERERYRLAPGDVLVSEGSAGAEAVGMPAAWNGEISGPVCFQNTLLRYRAIDGVTIPEFVRHWCLWAYESGTFRDTAPPGVNIKHIGDRRAKSMPVHLPDRERQAAISAELEPMVETVAMLKDETERLRTTRSALLDALLTRKVEVTDFAE